MDKDTRNAIERATQRARNLIEEDFAEQLEGDFDVHRDGSIAANAGAHLSARQTFQRERVVAAIEHKRAAGISSANAVRDYLRDAAFTTLNRFVALKMLEARELVQECITRGEQSRGYREFCGMAPGLPLVPDSAGYRLYIESLFEELSTEVKVLFDRRDPSSVLWPKRTTFDQLLEILNENDLAGVWGEDETIGWVYQYFNGKEERAAMRDVKQGGSQAPRNSRELAVRNQFFTPRYVVQFLADNTLGRIWYEMRRTQTTLAEKCEHLVCRSGEEFASRAKKDPRDLRVLDPACGSGHFLLYVFDLLLAIYEEAHADPESPKSSATGKTLAEDYTSVDALRKAIPGLVLAHNLHGVDIDARCAQIAQLALWMRAQKAYRDFGIGRAERPQIRRSNIVVAEPLVADDQIAKEFVAKLGDIELGRVFTSLLESLSLAGELGLLLRVEQLVKTPARKQGELFAPPEERIRAALDRFVREEASATNTRRRLFADDAAHGVALLGIAEKKFDAVLMNPPFGLLTPRGQDYLSSKYKGAHNDVYAAFIRRARSMAPEGMVGAITSRSFLVTKRLENFRREDVIPTLRLLWDLGLGVMDAASVESAAYVLGASLQPILAADGRRKRECMPNAEDWLAVDRDQLTQLPLAKILYDLPTEVHQILALQSHFEPENGTAREGMKSFDNERFVRLFWEVEPSEIGGCWRRFAKGGRNLRVFARHPLVLGYRNNGRELDEKNRQVNGSTAQVRQASDYWFRSGATYSRRAPEFAPRFLPADYIFSDKGPAVLSTSDASPEYLLGWLNSRLIRYLVHLQAHKQDYLTGILKKLPWATPSKEVVRDVEDSVRRALRAWLEVEVREETSPYYCAPGNATGLRTQIDEWKDRDQEAADALRACLSACDGLIDSVYSADSARWPQIADDEDASETDEDDDEAPTPTSAGVTRLLSWAVGTALGRWDARALCTAPEDAFASPPSRQPGELQRPQSTVVLPDDPGHPNDILPAAFHVCAQRWGTDISSVVEEFELELGLDGVRRVLRESRSSDGLWPYQRDTHTAQRRSAPTLWRLGTASGSYSLWINARGASADTLYQALQAFVDPKLRYEESRLAELRAGTIEGSRAQRSRAFANQEGVVDELQQFRDDLATVAPMWAPNPCDGFAICAAPLWRLVPFDRNYQKELLATWQSLCRGDFDWAHLAMHLWPERVVPACAKDHSLAIAHGLEGVFWVEGTDGRWTARKAPTKSIDDLVKERTSPAVKSALNTFLEAPVASGKSTGAGRSTARRKGTATVEGDT